MSFISELKKRRTFAIISHPDAGKTTLTEKLLLFGGAIQTAGAVKSNKIKKTATSDFMEIEKQRGISVATSVMTFEYGGRKINILDTPGHKDFAEDTYRTLTAVDSVILVIDCVKGVEEQTERLMEVCRMRDTPVIVFVNKMDREGKDPFDLLDELEQKLSIKVRPITWPVNMGSDFKGVYHLLENRMNYFKVNKTKLEDDVKEIALDSPELDASVGVKDAAQLREDVEMIETIYDDFKEADYLAGSIAPVFFGSAVNSFGIKELLDSFCNISPEPISRNTSVRLVEPTENKFTGFVFKIHANIDPRHRDRIAFLRICSGKFERGKFYKHVRLGKDVRFSNPYMFMADSKNVVDEGFPGDVVGLYDTGNFKIGDTLTEGELMFFTGIPSFSPELFREVINTDPLKSKQLEKGVSQLAEEGVAQLFTMQPGNRKIIGTVGELQFEVIQHRLLHEYGASCRFESKPYSKACWITSKDSEKLNEFMRLKSNFIALDKDDNPVFLAETDWILRMNKENNPEVEFHTTSEFNVANS
ncbi:peptide chain release factor 3 [Lacihabitans soyangensis]|uniref:Peptide chain release factor 3 n=1 Tax=Lacihabitans soyangensis TaxID=869394 RepID=A0AAE3H0K0_9BACT|nr:peptide chain release factor 3 [Lacihabitans soyangensis]MCP9762722.1 peptide chain release factor 3 [Lacihabitans soyangensis]